MFEQICTYIYRIFFAIALLLLTIGIWDRFIGLFGYRLTWLPYSPNRLLVISVCLIIFVISFLLRQVRDLSKK